MNEEIVLEANGKQYKDFRAYHIAMGMAVRYALIDFYKEVKKYAIQQVKKFYETNFGSSEYYENTYGMINLLENSEQLQSGITYIIKGSFDKKYTFELNIDWDGLDSHSNGYGQFGTYTSFNGESVVNNWEELLEGGLPIYPNDIRRPAFNLPKIIEEYVDKKIEKVVDTALAPFK